MAEHRSESGRGRRLLSRAGEVAATAAGALSGKNLEQQIQEYGDVYTQVLLGVHGDLELQSKKVDDHDKQIEALKGEIAAQKWIRTISIVACTLALVAVGISLWTALLQT